MAITITLITTEVVIGIALVMHTAENIIENIIMINIITVIMIDMGIEIATIIDVTMKSIEIIVILIEIGATILIVSTAVAIVIDIIDGIGIDINALLDKIAILF